MTKLQEACISFWIGVLLMLLSVWSGQYLANNTNGYAFACYFTAFVGVVISFLFVLSACKKISDIKKRG